jgi:hypothetical protein
MGIELEIKWTIEQSYVYKYFGLHYQVVLNVAKLQSCCDLLDIETHVVHIRPLTGLKGSWERGGWGEVGEDYE